MVNTTKFSALLFLAVVIAIFVAATPIGVLAHMGEDEEGELAEGKELFDGGVSCDKLNNEQLEAIGEYLMEQMHPGDAHEAMHRMMGIEEGTPFHDRFHINLAQAMYCATDSAAPTASGMMASGGMMPMMRMMPMMTAMTAMTGQGAQGMMHGSAGIDGGANAADNWNLFTVLYLILLIGLIGLVYLWLVRLWKGPKSKHGAGKEHGG